MFFIRIYFIIVWQGGLQIACQNKGEEQKGSKYNTPSKSKSFIALGNIQSFMLLQGVRSKLTKIESYD